MKVYLAEEIVANDEKAFEAIFKAHYNALHAYAQTMLRDEIMAEEIVQGLFLKLWEKKENLAEQVSVKAYLYKCVYHDCLNHIRHQKVQTRYTAYAALHQDHLTATASARAELSELQQHIDKALNDLPQQCRTVFQMSRFEELKYREIAEQLNISVKTVETQMGKALKLLRSKLADFLPLIFCLSFLNLNNLP
ncbi:MAG: RNA polymerase sigma-70 factor [Pedobacter sp.]|nr:MAG: RNA polymerase sigma-70 factor [Pedobacter sp.]